MGASSRGSGTYSRQRTDERPMNSSRGAPPRDPSHRSARPQLITGNRQRRKPGDLQSAVSCNRRPTARIFLIVLIGLVLIGARGAFAAPFASLLGMNVHNVSLPFPVPVGMPDPELPSSFLARELVLDRSRVERDLRPGMPGRVNLSMNAALPASTCNSYRPGTVRFTQYWIPIENTQDAPWGVPAVLSGAPTVNLLECNTGRTFGKTSKIFWDACHVQGTCYTNKKVLLNLMGKRCFRALDRSRYPFGVGSRNNPLVPFVSVAVNDLPFGTFLWIKELYGKVVPGTNGMLHNGCVRVDDTGWGVDPCHVSSEFATERRRWLVVVAFPRSRLGVADGRS